jgi:hypothetical protein
MQRFCGCFSAIAGGSGSGITLNGAGSASLTGWSGSPPTKRDLHRYAAVQLAGPVLTGAIVVALLAIGVALLDDPAIMPPWQAAGAVAALSLGLANVCALGICCCAPGHDIWLLRAALRASRADRLPATLREAVLAHAPPGRG